MSYIEQLKEHAEKNQSIVCMGMDPVIEKIPISGGNEEKIVKFYSDILSAIKTEGVRPGIVKPNYAFYEQYGMEGLRALKKVIELYKQDGFMIIMDAKRGDIGKTSAAYARGMFDFWGVDALTVAPYMGFDSVGPFVDYCDKGKSVYILCRTSNDGAVDLQGLECLEGSEGREGGEGKEGLGGSEGKEGSEVGKKLFMKTAEMIVGRWHKDNVSAVVGATSPEELKMVSEFFVKSGKHIPMLIPGVGAQGGSAEDVVKVLQETNNPLWLHRINSSSGINFAYEKEETDDYAGAAVRAIKKLNEEIGYGAR